MQTMTFMLQPQTRQISISILNTRFKRCAQLCKIGGDFRIMTFNDPVKQIVFGLVALIAIRASFQRSGGQRQGMACVAGQKRTGPALHPGIVSLAIKIR